MTNTDRIPQLGGKGENEGTRCMACGDRGWTYYQVETIDGEQVEALELCPSCTPAITDETKENAPLVKRILRGINLWNDKGDEVEKIDEGLYRVPSCAREGCFYRVRINEAGERCQCWDFGRNGLGACKHTVAALLVHAKEVRPVESGEVLVELHKNLTDVTGAYVGKGYVIVEGMENGSVLEILPSTNVRMFSRKNASARASGEVVARCESRAEAHTVILGLTKGRAA